MELTQFDPLLCQTAITGESYFDFIVEYGGDLEGILNQYKPTCFQIINEHYVVLHGTIIEFPNIPLAYSPMCLSPLTFDNTDLSSTKSSATDLSATDLSAIEESGILPLFTQPFLQLRGNGVLIAIIDSGIDYTHPAFVYEDNTSKIISLWDQTIVGTPPEGFYYGTEYTTEQINTALTSETPPLVVPSVDESGHGTFLAGVAAGRFIPENNFSGSAPNSDLVIVKLKPAKNYLRELYIISPEATIYQDNDIMMGIKFALQKASELKRPLVICLSLGTNLGGHDGRSIFEEYLDIISSNRKTCVVTAMGNETTLARHTSLSFTQATQVFNINIRIGPNEAGFLMNIWGEAPDSFTVGIITPSGESVQQVPARLGQRDLISFILEPTTILIEYHIIENRTGGPLINMRFNKPSEGIWTIRLARVSGVNQTIHMWLPCCNWITTNTYFMEPNADTTLVVPASARLPISVGGYNHRTNSIYIYSSRGNTRYGLQKPDFVAPAVDVFGPLPNNSYGTLSGTSIAAAITVGAAALLFEWGIGRTDFNIDSIKIKNLIIRGATRAPNVTYPNKEVGYGSLNLINTFNTLRSDATF
jgi:subtilisin family serine protease